MKELVKIDCYIEEYKNQSNCLSARLRDKKTNKKIILSGGFKYGKGSLYRLAR